MSKPASSQPASSTSTASSTDGEARLPRAIVRSSPAKPYSGLRLILVRHGESWSNVENVFAGEKSCRGLTDRGHRQAEAVARYLAAEKHRLGTIEVHSTAVRRAIHTAQHIAQELAVSVRVGFPYNELGSAEGQQRHTVVPERARGDSPDYPIAPGADSWPEAANRVGRMLDVLTARASSDTIILCCHRETILAVAQHLQRITPTLYYATAEVDYTAITEWQCRGRSNNPGHRRWVLIRHNDTRHFTAAVPT
ncbi:putative phosphoglycerate mutase [Nocardia tenerifensis]|uniref:Putative phosphoglycerate mutase n=1 Tax=Nocardia tenerifensis TaxID=228006 RepID=A0A318KCS8_9NOCA|nr:histidine phosphatase family protein [Nocardia tenerifensis]PXX71637.1 putative phosphoglycerate mutase [Nocardia tenerifensis]